MMEWSPPGGGLPPVTVNVPSRAALLADLRNRLERQEGFTVATINLDHVVKLRRDDRFRRAYAAHSHVTADGRPIVWLSRLAGNRVGLVTGSDLVDPLMALCADTASPVAFLGSTEPVLARAAAELSARHPGLEVVATLAPPMGFDPEGAEADALIDRLGRSGARLCLVALGAPRQERFAARAARALPKTGFASIGAGLDFVAGIQVRAPRLVRAVAAEWLWRMLRDPRRLGGRYASCLAVLPGLTAAAAARRFGQRRGPAG